MDYGNTELHHNNTMKVDKISILVFDPEGSNGEFLELLFTGGATIVRCNDWPYPEVLPELNELFKKFIEDSNRVIDSYTVRK